jgi:diguanylate cyclase
MKFLTKRTIFVLVTGLISGAGLWASSLVWSRSAGITPVDLRVLWFWFLQVVKCANLEAMIKVFGSVQLAFPLVWSMGLIMLGAAAGFLSAPRIIEGAQRLGSQNPAQTAAEIATARRRLDEELATVLNLIQLHLEKNKRYTAALARGDRQLALLEAPEQVRTAIVFLINENQQMLREVEIYKKNLEGSKLQITALRTALMESQELSARDALTGVYTRRHFDAVLAKEVSEAKRDVSSLSLIMADIDDFKKFNDTYGHLVGDEILKGVAKIISTNLNGRDTVARFGGEEFAILLPETALKGAVTLAEEIRGRLKDTKWTLRGGSQIEAVTASFGVAEFSSTDSPEDLLQRADAKLYMAKSEGRNCVVSADENADSQGQAIRL